ncbi:hypothetical protein SAMN05421819_2207 [Bryocella elongata]|uniref:Chitosanase of glycosyl hydrolase group 75 n=1 Tax=Bryocella elongata TaxID=863522 RepID=A0A1H5YAE4_9BACT|nr:hypothetical protein [Bryocella elongata]SEG20948.1 hypothetical protein SAMN05421819_2207 [Bryocella elongata]
MPLCRFALSVAFAAALPGVAAPAILKQQHPAFEILTRRMDVDVDGAPTAYGPRGKKTLDYLKNAHYRARPNAPIVGFLTDDDDPTKPVIQGPHDPAPGYYISQTAFTDPARTREEDPLRYVDATRINYVVLGDEGRRRGAQLGDFVAVYSHRTHRAVFGIVADDGNPSGNEGSLHLLQDLGYPFKDGKDESVTHAEVVIRFFPHSNPRQLFFREQRQLDATAEHLGLSRDFSQSELTPKSR